MAKIATLAGLLLLMTNIVARGDPSYVTVERATEEGWLISADGSDQSRRSPPSGEIFGCLSRSLIPR